jgi:hypothetical protein
MSGESMRKVVGITVGTPMSVSAVANALKGSASGNPIRLDDVSPLEHEIAVKATKAETNYTIGEKVTDVEWYASSNVDIEADGGTYVFRTITSYGDGDSIIFDDGSYWEGCGQLNDEDYEGRSLSEVLSVGEVVCIGHRYDDENVSLFKATATETIIPANGATVEKYGRNLFDVGGVADYFVTTSITIISIDRENQTITANSNTDGSQLFVNTKKRYPRGTYTAQAAKNTNGNPRILVRLYDESGLELTNSSAMVVGMTYNEWHKGWFKDASSVTFTIPSEAAYWCFGLVSTNISGTITTFSNIQVELGNTATEYEKSHCETLTADENGNVEGIIGNGETVTLMAESGVSISAEYNRDINKAFAEIQQAIATMGAAAVTIPEEV